MINHLGQPDRKGNHWAVTYLRLGFKFLGIHFGVLISDLRERVHVYRPLGFDVNNGRGNASFLVIISY